MSDVRHIENYRDEMLITSQCEYKIRTSGLSIPSKKTLWSLSEEQFQFSTFFIPSHFIILIFTGKAIIFRLKSRTSRMISQKKTLRSSFIFTYASGRNHSTEGQRNNIPPPFCSLQLAAFGCKEHVTVPHQFAF